MFDLGSVVHLTDDSQQRGRIILYRPSPQPLYGVEFDPRRASCEWLFVNGPDGLNRLYAIEWIPERDLRLVVRKTVGPSANELFSCDASGYADYSDL